VQAFAAALGLEQAAFQTAPVLHVMSADLRVPGGYYGYPVHQDWPALQSSLDTITAWIPFVSVDESNYTMDVIPGSHLGGLYPGTMTPNAYEIEPGAYREEDFVPVRAEPGDVFFMSCFMVHRSSVRGGDRVRIASSMRYENAAEDAFAEHAYPYVHKRVVEREFLVPDYPSAAQVRAAFGQ
jgi:ectoine hydroxylase-related dioxygenase (phytanoyl-CoA dioxygenase family)